MRTSRWLFAFAAAVGCLAASARQVEACSCAGGVSPCEAFAQSPIVFVGEVLSSQETGPDFHLRLKVLRALKGITARVADIWSEAHSSCGIQLTEGKRYVVYTSLADGRMSIQAYPAASTARSCATTSI